jgi:hypothetical protein
MKVVRSPADVLRAAHVRFGEIRDAHEHELISGAHRGACAPTHTKRGNGLTTGAGSCLRSSSSHCRAAAYLRAYRARIAQTTIGGWAIDVGQTECEPG